MVVCWSFLFLLPWLALRSEQPLELFQTPARAAVRFGWLLGFSFCCPAATRHEGTGALRRNSEQPLRVITTRSDAIFGRPRREFTGRARVVVAKEILSWDPSRLPNEESSFDSSARFLLEAKQKKLASP